MSPAESQAGGSTAASADAPGAGVPHPSSPVRDGSRLCKRDAGAAPAADATEGSPCRTRTPSPAATARFEPVEGQVFDGPAVMTVEGTVPPGCAVGRTPYGLGCFATRAFRRGEVLYRGRYLVIPGNLEPAAAITLRTDRGDYALSVAVHTVAQADGRRQLFMWDGHMNHACEPNTFSANETCGDAGGEYDTVALRDIAPGEQITCDYDLFEWDSRDKGIDACGCGAATCRGSSHGFAFLPPAEQRRRLGAAYDEVVCAWCAEHPRTLFRRIAPPAGLRIGVDVDGGCTLYAERPFARGETVFANASELVEVARYDDLLVALPDPEAATEGERALRPHVTRAFEFLVHTTNYGGGLREFYGFDSFCAHSCDPNAAMDYLEGEGTSYRMVARRAIAAGEEVSCDYTLLRTGEPDHTAFRCRCGAAGCKGDILA